MTDHSTGMKSIWYLVGAMLIVMGLLVLAGGIADLAAPPAHVPVLAHLRANLWWGALMTAAGAVFYLTHRKPRRG